MKNIFNQGFLKNFAFYIVLAFALATSYSFFTQPTISNDSITKETVLSSISDNSKTHINKVISKKDIYYIEMAGEEKLHPISDIEDSTEFSTTLKNLNIDVIYLPTEMDGVSIALLGTKIFFLLLLTSFFIVVNEVSSVYSTLKKEEQTFKEHFKANLSKVYFPHIKEVLVKYSNPKGNKFFLLGFILCVSFSIHSVSNNTYSTNYEKYIYSDLITDIKNNKVSFVDIQVKDGVTSVIATKNNEDKKYFNISNSDELKTLLVSNDIRFNEKNSGESLNFTPFLITAFIFLGVMLIISIISKSINNSKGGFLKGKDFVAIATKPNVTLNDVKGIEEIKDEITEVIELLNNKVGTNSLGGKTPHGILTDGAPGVGKTLLAKAISNETNYNFFYTNGSEFAGQLQGQGADNIKRLFESARKQQPAIIFIDEIDGVGQKRGANHNSSDTDRTLNALLVELDGFDTKDDNIIVIGATNFPDQLDKALIRAGRFDREITIPLPRYKGRLELLEYFVSKVKADQNIDLSVIAHHTSGFSGASLENLVNEAALLAGRRNKQLIEKEDFEEAQAKLLMGHKLPIEMSVKEKWNTSYHEAGHAIVSELSESQHMKVHKVSIIPRGRALGVTVYIPEEESYSLSKNEIESNIASLYGGRIAEELVVGENEVSTGASNDFARATEEAEKMVKHFGLNSTSLLTLGYKDTRGSNNISDSDKKTMEDILKRNYIVAAEILSENKLTLRNFAKALMLFDTIESEQIKKIINGEDITISDSRPNGFEVPPEYDILLKKYQIKLLEEK